MSEKFEGSHRAPPTTDVVPSAFEDPMLVHVPLTDLADPREVQDGLTGRERVAVWFAAVILALIIIICGTLLWEHHIQMPQIAGSADQKTAIENYKALIGLMDDRTEKFFDLFVTKALLPVFTTLIGFILGRQSKEN